VEKDFAPKLKQPPPTSGSLSNNRKVLSYIATFVILFGALGTGIWLQSSVWQNRKLIWQLQAALIGGSIGFVAGRLSR
jgi:hypothetical protein